MNLLRSVGGTLSPRLTIETQIGFLGRLYLAKKIALRAVIGSLLSLVHDQGVTDQQRIMIYSLDDIHDLAVAGTYGTVGQVESEFRSFVQPYVENLSTQEIDMFEEGEP
jgi:hypothetical protein